MIAKSSFLLICFRIYDSVTMAAPPTPAVVAKKKQEELVKVKQEKQLEITFSHNENYIADNTSVCWLNIYNSFQTHVSCEGEAGEAAGDKASDL